jgi:hypothetical protein
MESVVYRERVLPSAATFALAPLLWVFIYAVMLPLDEVLGFAIATVAGISLATLLLLKAPVIEVTGETLRVGRATIQRKLLGALQEISSEDSFAERGHQLNALAYTSFQGSVRTMLKVDINDKSDPTPYWLFCTRNPAELKKALN